MQRTTQCYRISCLRNARIRRQSKCKYITVLALKKTNIASTFCPFVVVPVLQYGFSKYKHSHQKQQQREQKKKQLKNTECCLQTNFPSFD